MKELIGKVAVITGVADPNSIGFGIAKEFCKEGATVIILDIQKKVFDREADLIKANYSCKAFQCDLTKKEKVKELFQKIFDLYTHIDILINNAGKSIPPRPPFHEMSEEYFDKVFSRNFKTTFHCCKQALPYMINQKYGKIINISSLTGPKTVYRYSTAYAAAKGAVSAFTRALALELGKYNINVNAILPGFIDIHKKRWSPENDTYKFNKTPELQKWPIHSPGFPKDIADLALFLASDKSRYITGEEIVIDGGASILEPIISPEDQEYYSDRLLKKN